MKQDKLTIDKRSGIPLIHQISNFYEAQIIERKLKKSDLLPLPEILAAELEIPKQAVKASYQRLIDIKLVSMNKLRQYEVTYVELPDQFHTKLTSMTEAIQMMGLNPSIELIEKKIIEDEQMNISMGFSKNETLFMMKRLYLGDGIPIYLIIGYFPLSIFKDLDKLPIDEKTYLSMFKEHYQIDIVESYRIFSPYNVDQETADLLQISKGKAVYQSITTAKDQYQRHIEYGIAYSTSHHRIPLILEKTDIEVYFK
ncbi:MAG: hypothetical protein CVV61_06335 [Tenericutes bacterium HGW-Tenericutes-6]|nr:MAG: hypothetical protein CVV61_06335 [Tenericutes bacterium HGW-Tenericutes-6]